jgi:cytoskeleton protein RodZ
MSDMDDAGAADAPQRPTTAGGMLRQARQARGLHIAALAAAIKIVPRKLELLESDQFDQLLDATFTRALAQTVCRALKIDAGPILALLPPIAGQHLVHVAEGLNTPFKDRPGRLVPKEWATVASPALWIAALLVIAAVAVYLLPAGWLTLSRPAAAGASAAVSVTTVTPSATEPPQALPAQAPAASAAAEATAPAAQSVAPPMAAEAAASAPESGVLQLRATAPSWVEVTDARGRALIARVLQPGEDIGLDGVMPLKVRIGNSGGTQVVFRGQPLELASFTRDNVARLDLK